MIRTRGGILIPVRRTEDYRGVSGFTHFHFANEGHLKPNSAMGAAAPALGQLVAFPWPTARGYQLTSIAFEVTVAGAAGSVGRVGIYRHLPSFGGPGALVFDGGSQDCTVIGVKTTAIPNLIVPGDDLLWLVTLFGVAAPTIRVGDFGGIMGLGGGATLNNPRTGMQVPQAFGPLPDPFPAAGLASFFANTHAVAVQVATTI